MSQLGVWDLQQWHEYLAEKKDTLVKLDELVPWSEFCSILEEIPTAIGSGAINHCSSFGPIDVAVIEKAMEESPYDVVACTEFWDERKAREAESGE